MKIVTIDNLREATQTRAEGARRSRRFTLLKPVAFNWFNALLPPIAWGLAFGISLDFVFWTLEFLKMRRKTVDRSGKTVVVKQCDEFQGLFRFCILPSTFCL